MNKNEIGKIELLEKELANKIGVYKNYKNSEKNDTYFSTLHYRAITKLEESKRNVGFQLNPTLGYALLFIISFITSFQIIDFSNTISLSEESYLFADNTLWIEEEGFLVSVIDDFYDLDYADYLTNEISYFPSSDFYDDEISEVSESDFNEIFETMKNKKIL
jgi:hypothetical protein